MAEYGTHWWGICDTCRKVEEGFVSREARDEWEATHEHLDQEGERE